MRRILIYSNELQKQRDLSNNLAKLIVDFAGDVKKPVLDMAECLENGDLSDTDNVSIIPELSRNLKYINDRLNTFVGIATNLYLTTNPPQ